MSGDKIKELLEKQISELKDSMETMQAAAANNPFGANVDLEAMAVAHLDKCQQRVSVRIWQKHRLKTLEYLLGEINEG